MKTHATCGLAVVALAVLAFAGARDAAAEPSFTAKLKPNHAVLAAKSSARGMVKFRLSEDGGTLHYQVDAFDVGVVSQIHIHLGTVATSVEGQHYHVLPPEGGHGETVGFLLNFSPEGAVANGTVAKGTLSAADLMGSLKGQPMKVLIDHIEQGWAYVNLHVVQDMGQGRRYCCPTGMWGIVRKD